MEEIIERSGIVTRRTKGFYYLRVAGGEEIECKVKGQLFQNSRYDNQIAVGDIVFFRRDSPDTLGLITRIQDRKSFYPETESALKQSK